MALLNFDRRFEQNYINRETNLVMYVSITAVAPHTEVGHAESHEVGGI